MEQDKFIEKRPFLFHLTDQRNLPLIIKYGRLFSTNVLIDRSRNEEYNFLKRAKRKSHFQLDIDGEIFSIRDQQPISEIALKKCLTNNWECADFYECLNNRVFMWPNLDRLWRHYNRYVNENPVILRFETNLLLDINSNAKYCRLNSGATRANSYLGGRPPERGIDTFKLAGDFTYSIGSVAEVTFENECILPGRFYRSNSPDGDWDLMEI